MTYPPDFSYLTEERLRPSMWVLAAEISRLDALLQIEPATTDAIPSDDKAFFHTTPSPELDLSKHERRIQ